MEHGGRRICHRCGVVMGGQLVVPSAEESVSPLVSDIGGAVVPVMGAQPIQASLGAKSLPVADRQSQNMPSAARQVGAAYERLAHDRYRLLNAQHANQAARSRAPCASSMCAKKSLSLRRRQTNDKLCVSFRFSGCATPCRYYPLCCCCRLQLMQLTVR